MKFTQWLSAWPHTTTRLDSFRVASSAASRSVRSSSGTGTSARLAHLHATGRLPVGQAFVHESYIGSRFTGRVEAETEVGGRPAIIPSVEGSAIATGLNEIWIDDEDVFAHGFQVI